MFETRDILALRDYPARVASQRERSWAAAALARRRALFVGRVSELGALDAALTRAGTAPQLVAVVGPGGIGKSCLARRFSDEVRAVGGALYWLSGDELPPNPEDLLGALRAQGVTGFEALGVGPRPDVLVLDAFERLASLAHWFFDRMLPLAGARLLVVVTSRERLDPRLWRDLRMQIDPQEFVLGALSHAEAMELLSLRHVPSALQGRICQSCHGHALSISLLAERFSDSSRTEFDAAFAEDVVGSLARELVRTAPSEGHRRALRALSIASALDLRLCAAIVGEEQADAMFDWLERSTLASVGPRGLTPHPLVRDAVFAHSLARDSEEHQAIAEAIVAELLRRLAETPIERKLQLVLSMIFARRDLAFVREGLGLDQLAQVHLRVARGTDADEVAAQIEQHEGSAGARWFRHWYALQPENLFVVIDQDDRPQGVYFLLEMDRTSEAQRAGDPLACAAAQVAATVGSGTGFARWCFAREGYQRFGPELTAVLYSGPILCALRDVQHIVFTVTDPERWSSLAGPFRMARRPEFDTEIDGEAHGVFHRDLREVADGKDVARDVANVSSLLSTLGMGPAAPPRKEAPPVAALDEAAFAIAVRGALPLLHRPHELAQSPLLTSTMLALPEGASPLEAAAALADRLREACSELRASPAYAASARVLEVTFLELADKQRAAAASLNLPYGTYRHQLRAAITLLVKQLWARELVARKAGQLSSAARAAELDPSLSINRRA